MCTTWGDISSSSASFEAKHNTPGLSLTYFSIFPPCACDDLVVFSSVYRKKNEWSLWNRPSQAVCFRSPYTCFVHWCCWEQTGPQLRAWKWGKKARSAVEVPAFACFGNSKARVMRALDRFWFNNDRLRAAHGEVLSVFYCETEWESQGTLFASAPSRPDVLAFKRTGSGLQLSFPHCI